jgi:hypothetical protein
MGVAMSEKSFLTRGDGDRRQPRCATETTKGKQEGNHLHQLAGLSFFLFSFSFPFFPLD